MWKERAKVNHETREAVIKVHALVVYGYKVQTPILPIDMRDELRDLTLKLWGIC